MQVPSKEQAASVTEELRARSALPDYLKKVLKTLPEGTHPMTQLSMAIMALQVPTAYKYTSYPLCGYLLFRPIPYARAMLVVRNPAGASRYAV